MEDVHRQIASVIAQSNGTPAEIETAILEALNAVQENERILWRDIITQSKQMAIQRGWSTAAAMLDAILTSEPPT